MLVCDPHLGSKLSFQSSVKKLHGARETFSGNKLVATVHCPHTAHVE